jgi:succinate dehydrogenase / fumarate reductase cytochrome b subunit
MRVVLVASVVVHIVAAERLTHRALHQRPRKHSKKSLLGRNYVAFTMRSGGVILALFVVWHILDLTALVVNARGQSGHPYQNLVAGFSLWYPNVIYLVAMLALGFHLWHGIWSAATTLGVRSRRHRAVKLLAAALSIVVTVGFAAVPVAVMTGMVS